MSASSGPFSKEGSAMKIQTKAKAHGTFNSPTTGSILYVDPKHSDKQHSEPLLTLAEAKYAHERGLIEDFDETKDAEDDTKDEPERDPNALGTKAAERTEQFAQQDDEGGKAPSALDSRSSTAWPDRDRVEGDAEGFTDGVRTSDAGDAAPPVEVDTDSGDDDAPPAAPKRNTGPKRTAAPAA
jgi:hypothetical protein